MLKKRLKTNNIKGFTLIELLVSMVIISIMLFISLDTTVKLIRQGEKSDLRGEVDRSINYAVETIKRNISQSSLDAIKFCASSTPNSCLQINNIQYKYMAPTSTYLIGKIVEQNIVDPNAQCFNSCDLSGSTINITSLIFNKAPDDVFVGINVTLEDSHDIIYTRVNPLSIVTGAIARD